jgi:molecular chaperone GrpE (heat shock protein)
MRETLGVREDPVDEGASGTVVDEAARGYLWNDELLRPARVLVAE